MRSETPTGASTRPVVSTAEGRGSSVPAPPAEHPYLDEATVCFPDRVEFFDQNDVDEATEAANRAIGEHLALMGICWGEES